MIFVRVITIYKTNNIKHTHINNNNNNNNNNVMTHHNNKS